MVATTARSRTGTRRRLRELHRERSRRPAHSQGWPVCPPRISSSIPFSIASHAAARAPQASSAPSLPCGHRTSGPASASMGCAASAAGSRRCNEGGTVAIDQRRRARPTARQEGIEVRVVLLRLRGRAGELEHDDADPVVFHGAQRGQRGEPQRHCRDRQCPQPRCATRRLQSGMAGARRCERCINSTMKHEVDGSRTGTSRRRSPDCAMQVQELVGLRRAPDAEMAARVERVMRDEESGFCWPVSGAVRPAMCQLLPLPESGWERATAGSRICS